MTKDLAVSIHGMIQCALISWFVLRSQVLYINTLSYFEISAKMFFYFTAVLRKVIKQKVSRLLMD
jgi:hypothetical protein